MKVFTYLALLGGAAAIRLMSHHAITQPTQMRSVLLKLNQSEDWPELNEEQMKEIEDWVKSEIGQDGTGTITKEEATAAFEHFAEAHGFEFKFEIACTPIQNFIQEDGVALSLSIWVVLAILLIKMVIFNQKIDDNRSLR